MMWARSLATAMLIGCSATLAGEGSCPVAVQAHDRWISCVAFSPDGTRIASGGDDGALKLWDALEVGDLRRRLGQMDRHRLDQYLESVREVEKRLNDKEEILARGRPEFDEHGVRTEPQGKSGMQEHIEMMMDLIALAFQTDMTRVITHSLGGEGGPNYDDYKDWAKQAGGQLRGAHDFHHKGSGNRGADNADVKVLGYRDKMFCACLARLMDKLKAIQTNDGTLLDHTVLLMGGSQVSSHSGGSFPMLLAGGRKLGFRQGQHVRWKAGTKAASDLYLTILRQLGCPVTSFKESTGPLSEILA